ncbi:MAG: N-acetylmuramoyl-L-alanine amidase [Pleurocapsa sp.]
MRFHWILASVCGIFLFCSPARAGKILSWEFEHQNNSLVFVTDEGVQPTAQLLNNPTRLVIDLPGTILGRETVKETYSGAIRGFRIGQPEPNTSRIVIEFAPGYTIDPEEIKFRGLSSNQWTVELPQPKIASVTATTRSSPPKVLEVPTIDTASSLPELEPADVNHSSPDAIADSPYVTTTRNGFLIKIDGSRKHQPMAKRDGDRLEFDLTGVVLPDDLVSQSVAVGEYGVNKIEFTQTSTSPPEAKMSLQVSESSPDWLATFSRIGGLILVPRGNLPASNTAANSSNESPPQPEIKPEVVLERPPTRPETGIFIDKPETKVTTIEQVELIEDGEQLRIKGDRELKAVTTTPGNGVYEVQINNAELSEDFEGPKLQAGSPISQVRVRQEGSMVVVTATTRLRYRLGQIDADGQEITLPIERGLASLPPNTDTPLIPPQSLDIPQPEISSQPIPNPIPSNRPLVIIDPGHGGKDPGAIGIGGLMEKDIVLPISLDVAEILRKQGIEVKMTRDTDNFISLQGRTDLANNIDADLFVSIHANAINMSRPDVNGLETYYYQSGRRLAEVIHWSILNDINIDDRGIRRARFYVLRHSAMPAVLVEVGFVTGAKDAPNLKSPSHRRQMAEAIARGIIQYIKQNNL